MMGHIYGFEGFVDTIMIQWVKLMIYTNIL